MSTLELIGEITKRGWMVSFIPTAMNGEAFVCLEAQKSGAHLSVRHHADLLTEERIQLSLRSFLDGLVGQRNPPHA